MMRTISLLSQFVEDLRARPVRTAVTVLGITWGTVAVVVLLAFGVGMGAKMKSDARGLGDGIVILFGGRTTKSYQGFPEGRGIRLLEDDAQLLQREVAGIGMISPEYGNGDTRVHRGTNGTEPYVTGVEPVYGGMRNIVLEPGGRFLDRLDLEQRRRVVVLGDGIKKLLFDAEAAVGKTVQIGDSPFLVIGVMEHKTQDSSYNSRDENRVFIPASTYRTVFGEHYVRNIVYRPADLAQTGPVRKQVYQVLARRHVFDPTDTDAIGVWDTNDMMRMFENLFAGFTIFLGIVGSFTLAVGGIGVANIMYIVVRERTPEIGIKRSVGARRRDILGQFLLETSLVVGVGAVLGLAISLGLVALARLLPIQDQVGTPTLSPAVLGITVLLLGCISFLAGIFPAWRAAHLDPVQCLRA
jgi:putative ABC transport system permease protein